LYNLTKVLNEYVGQVWNVNMMIGFEITFWWRFSWHSCVLQRSVGEKCCVSKTRTGTVMT